MGSPWLDAILKNMRRSIRQKAEAAPPSYIKPQTQAQKQRTDFGPFIDLPPALDEWECFEVFDAGDSDYVDVPCRRFIDFNPNTGRLFIAAFIRGPSSSTNYSLHGWYSDDEGETWSDGGSIEIAPYNGSTGYKWNRFGHAMLHRRDGIFSVYLAYKPSPGNWQIRYFDWSGSWSGPSVAYTTPTGGIYDMDAARTQDGSVSGLAWSIPGTADPARIMFGEFSLGGALLSPGQMWQFTSFNEPFTAELTLFYNGATRRVIWRAGDLSRSDYGYGNPCYAGYIIGSAYGQGRWSEAPFAATVFDWSNDEDPDALTLGLSFTGSGKWYSCGPYDEGVWEAGHAAGAFGGGDVHALQGMDLAGNDYTSVFTYRRRVSGVWEEEEVDFADLKKPFLTTSIDYFGVAKWLGTVYVFAALAGWIDGTSRIYLARKKIV